MKKLLALSLLLGMAAGAMTAALAAAPEQTQRMAFRSFTVEGTSLQGALQGPWEWAGSVTVKGSGLTLTCDSLKMWLTPDGRDAERVEASGNIRIAGRYVASDKTEWEVKGQAESGSYERKAGLGILKGAVSFEARNLSTGAVVSAAAEKLTYDLKSKRFRFERGERPVRMEWQEPEPQAGAGEAPVEGPQEESAK
ncbi:MAG TPA: LptA/OstA family protein [Armatimonadota bacterium]|nr:LptA/OstA family protein [Armatimonadota bacterium]